MEETPPADKSLVGGMRRMGFFGSSDFVASDFHGRSGAPPPPEDPAAALPIPASLAAGWEGPPTFGRFELLEELGRGGMGVVYRVRDPDADRELALKIVLSKAGDTKRLARFEREGQVTASLEHPGIVRVHSAGDVDGLPFLACELVEEARTLSEAFRTADRRRRVQYVLEAARALGFAHTKGVVHRDVKPDNLLVGRDDRVRVADFGLAWALDLDRITRTGEFMGTPLFMSPEQFSGKHKEIGPQTDVWALGVVLYLALTGEVPFDGANLFQLGAQVSEGKPPPPRSFDKTIPPSVEAVCLRALHPQIEWRYADGNAMADDLRAALSGARLSGSGESPLRRVVRQRGPALVVGGALAFALVTGLAVWLIPDPQVVTTGSTERTRARKLELTSPGKGAKIEGLVADLRGISAAETVELVVRVGRAEPRRIRPESDGSFAARVQLVPGENRLEIRCEGADGAYLGRVKRVVVSALGPDWYRRLPPNERAPYPLPAGLEFAGEGEYRNVKDGSVLVWVPAGSFRMGSDRGKEDQRPEHRVAFSRGFFIGKFELTWGRFQRFWLETHGERYPPRAFGEDGPPRVTLGDEHPVHGVTFAIAKKYLAWAGLRFPGEPEWEYAARGPKSLPFPWGDAPLDETHANIDGFRAGTPDRYLYTAPVGSFPAGVSPLGCFDMIGNVREFTLANAIGYPTDGVVLRDPKPVGAPMPPMPAQRGGSYRDVARSATPISRVQVGINLAEVEIDVGIRVARSAD